MGDRFPHRSWVWLLVTTVAVAPAGWAEEDDAEASLGLQLELVDLSGSQRFHLFPELAGTPDGDMLRLGQLAASASASGPPAAFQPSTPLTLTPALTFDLAEPGKAELRLFRVDRKTWDELDTWERIGLVTSYASALAGAVGLAFELLD